jgi:hypothetical protein
MQKIRGANCILLPPLRARRERSKTLTSRPIRKKFPYSQKLWITLWMKHLGECFKPDSMGFQYFCSINIPIQTSIKTIRCCKLSCRCDRYRRESRMFVGVVSNRALSICQRTYFQIFFAMSRKQSNNRYYSVAWRFSRSGHRLCAPTYPLNYFYEGSRICK